MTPHILPAAALDRIAMLLLAAVLAAAARARIITAIAEFACLGIFLGACIFLATAGQP